MERFGQSLRRSFFALSFSRQNLWESSLDESSGSRSTGTNLSVTLDMTSVVTLVGSLRMSDDFSIVSASSRDFSLGNRTQIDDARFLTLEIGTS